MVVNVVLLAGSQRVILEGKGEPDLVFDPEPPDEFQEGADADLVCWLARMGPAVFGCERKACRESGRHHRLLSCAGEQQPMPDPLRVGQEVDKPAARHLHSMITQIEIAVRS